MHPFFSVILTTFNRAPLVSRAIESALRQTFRDFELIIVDDGSVDNTFAVIRPFVLGDARIRYHYAGNRGLAMARNTGIGMASGKYVTFLDSDDEYLPEHLDVRARYLEEHPETELLHGGVEVIGDPFVADKFNPSERIPISDCVVGGTFVIRRGLFEKIGLFHDVPYGDDNEFFHRAEAAGVTIRKVDFPTYRYYRTESDSLCAIVEREGVEGIAAFRAQSIIQNK